MKTSIIENMKELDGFLVASNANRNDRVIVLIKFCIGEGFHDGPQLVHLVSLLKFKPSHVGAILSKSCGPDIERHFWFKDSLGRYQLHDGETAAAA